MQNYKSEKKENPVIISSIPFISKEKKITYLAKDNFWTENFPTTASSNFLTNFLPNQEASVIKFLKQKDFSLLGKTILDEFACGGTGLHAATGPIFNPYNSLCIVGGSSSGSAWIVAKKMVSFALGHDTGDSVRRPAAYCGIVGFKPSYGIISRAGVIPMASSLDTIGILGQQVKDVEYPFSIISSKDPHDLLTCASRPKTSATSVKKKVAIINGLENHLPSQLVKLYHENLEKLKKTGYKIEEVNIPKNLRENLQITYLILCSTELVSHLNSLQGITYGMKENISITQKRSKYLGEIVKQRLLIGNYFLDKEELVEKARKMRCLVNKWVEKVFQNYEFLIFPSTNNPAPPAADFHHSFSGLVSSHWSDNLLLLANFSGLPSLSLPLGFINNLPVSININSAYGNDKKVFELARLLEKNN